MEFLSGVSKRVDEFIGAPFGKGKFDLDTVTATISQVITFSVLCAAGYGLKKGGVGIFRETFPVIDVVLGVVLMSVSFLLAACSVARLAGISLTPKDDKPPHIMWGVFKIVLVGSFMLGMMSAFIKMIETAVKGLS